MAVQGEKHMNNNVSAGVHTVFNCGVCGTVVCDVKKKAKPGNLAALVEPLKKACDRAWEDETPEQIVAIAANAIYWREQEIAELRKGKTR